MGKSRQANAHHERLQKVSMTRKHIGSQENKAHVSTSKVYQSPPKAKVLGLPRAYQVYMLRALSYKQMRPKQQYMDVA